MKLKSLLSLAAVPLFAASICYAQPTWHTPTESTIAWDAVTTNVDGNLLEPDEVITYNIFLAAYPVLDRQNPLVHTKVAETTSLTYTIAFDQEGWWVAGVQAMRSIQDGMEVIEIKSTIAWSDDVDFAPNPFGWSLFLSPTNPKNLRMP